MTDHDHGADGASTSEASIAHLTAALSKQLARLVRDELELAQVELAHKARAAALGGAMLGAAAVTGFIVLGLFAAAAVAALHLVVAAWAAALIAAAACLSLTALLALTARRLLARATPPMPEEASAGVRDDVRLAKLSVQQARR